MIERKIYNKYIFTEKAEEKSIINQEIYKELISKFKVLVKNKFAEDVKFTEEEIEENEVLIFRIPKHKRSTYTIVKNDTSLKEEELMLIADGGSLCFGGIKKGELTFDIYED